MDALSVVLQHAVARRQWGVVALLASLNRHLASLRPSGRMWVTHVGTVSEAIAALERRCAAVHVCATVPSDACVELAAMARSLASVVVVDVAALDRAHRHATVDGMSMGAVACECGLLDTTLWRSACASSGARLRSVDVRVDVLDAARIRHVLPRSVENVFVRFFCALSDDAETHRAVVRMARRCRRLECRDVEQRAARSLLRALARSPPSRLRHLALRFKSLHAWTRPRRPVFRRLATIAARQGVRSVEIENVPPFLQLVPYMKRIAQNASLSVIVDRRAWSECPGERETFVERLAACSVVRVAQ